MKLAAKTYVPALKWRQAEYQALARLPDNAKARVVPLITVPTIEYDFEEQAPKHTVHEHVTPFAKRYKAKWGTHPAWIDFDPTIQSEQMDGGVDVITHVFTEIRKFNANAVPVASLDHPPEVINAVAQVIAQDKKGVGLRVRLEHVMLPAFSKAAHTLLAKLGVTPANTDLIVDLGVPVYEPYDVFANGLIALVGKIPSLATLRSFTIVGCAFPDSMKDVASPGDDLPRHDWLFFQTLLENWPAALRRPCFGDYTIVNPTFAANFDMRMVKPAGKLVYTTKKHWAVRKGGAFRDNPAQMHDHCAHIVGSRIFCGPTFSEGDTYIDRCSRKEVGPSNMPRWKQVGISHHVMYVLNDLSKPGGPS
jgi:Beta protein